MPDLRLVIGNKNYSSWSLRPWIFLRHFNLPFSEKWVSLSVETTYQELEPFFSDYKVPVLQDEGLTLWDSLAILEYLSETYLDNRGWPADKNARAIARSVSAEMHSSFPDLRAELPMNCRKQFSERTLSKAAQHDISRVMTLWNYCRTEFGSGGEWLFGDFSIADAMYAPVALRFHGYQIELDNNAQTYVTSMLNHPGIKEWVEAGRQEIEVIEEDEVKD